MLIKRNIRFAPLFSLLGWFSTNQSLVCLWGEVLRKIFEQFPSLATLIPAHQGARSVAHPCPGALSRTPRYQDFLDFIEKQLPRHPQHSLSVLAAFVFLAHFYPASTIISLQLFSHGLSLNFKTFLKFVQQQLWEGFYSVNIYFAWLKRSQPLDTLHCRSCSWALPCSLCRRPQTPSSSPPSTPSSATLSHASTG